MLPLYLDIYSSISPDFKSANNETIKLLATIEKKFKDKGIFVMDRGYDAGVILEYLYEKDLSFIVRSVGNRYVTYRGKNILVSKLCKSVINKRYKEELFQKMEGRREFQIHEAAVGHREMPCEKV